MIDIDALAKLEAAATPAPWRYFNNGFDGGITGSSNLETNYPPLVFGGEPCEGRLEGDEDDTLLTIAMRNALPGLLAEVRAAREWLLAYDAPGDAGWRKESEAYRAIVEANRG